MASATFKPPPDQASPTFAHISVRHWGTLPHRPDHVLNLVAKLAASGGRLCFCYEVGPCGYGLHRQLVEIGHECIVVAPSLIPVEAGDRVNTDRRDV